MCHIARETAGRRFKRSLSQWYELEVVIVCIFWFGLGLNLKTKRYLLGGIAGYVGRRIACYRRGVAADQIKKYSNKSSSIEINFSIALFGLFAFI